MEEKDIVEALAIASMQAKVEVPFLKIEFFIQSKGLGVKVGSNEVGLKILERLEISFKEINKLYEKYLDKATDEFIDKIDALIDERNPL